MTNTAEARSGQVSSAIAEARLRRSHRRMGKFPWFSLISIVGALVLWSILAAYVFSPLLLPSPLAVLKEGIAMAKTGELGRNVAATMERLAMGYVLGVVGGTVLGAIAGRAKLIRDLVMPIINLVRPLSPVALIPLFIIWFGIGELSKVLLVSYTTFVTLFFSALSGVASTPLTRERAGQSLGGGRVALLWHIILPSAVPYILTGMRIAVASAYMSVVAAELVAANAGLGFVIMSARVTLLTSRMFVGLVCLGILGLLTDVLLRKIIVRFGKRFLAEGIDRVV